MEQTRAAHLRRQTARLPLLAATLLTVEMNTHDATLHTHHILNVLEDRSVAQVGSRCNQKVSPKAPKGPPKEPESRSMRRWNKEPRPRLGKEPRAHHGRGTAGDTRPILYYDRQSDFFF